MDEITVSIKRMEGNEDIPLPQYMTERAAGMDIYAALDGDEVIFPGERKRIPTGIEIGLPVGYEAQIRPRSGLALQSGVTLVNSPGTIDSDYRGEIGIVMINHGKDPFVAKRGDRIAQMVINRVCKVTWHVRDNLESTHRGSGGFGHTG